MTVVNLTALETLLGGPGPVGRGHASFTYWAGSRPFVNVAGAQVIFPSTIVVDIVDGAPVVDIDLPPTGGVCCVRARVARVGSAGVVDRFVTVPDAGPVDFADLPVVDPELFAPVVVTPTLVETIQSVAWDRF